MKQNNNKLTEIEAFRLKVQENELVARFNKSEWEKMHYYLAAKEIAPRFLEEAKKDEAERLQMQDELMKSLQTQVDAQNVTANYSDGLPKEEEVTLN